MSLAITLYAVLFTAVLIAPLRCSVSAYILLSTIDLISPNASIGGLNAAKAIALPLYLLWRLRRYGGQRNIVVAPIVWALLTVYAAAAGYWSSYPVFAVKLAGHMTGLFIICMAFMRATKGGYITPSIVIPLTAGALMLALLRSCFAPAFGGEPDRFRSFSSAQSFAALLAALYCIALCSKSLKAPIRLALCAVLLAAIVLDGSRLWMLAVVVSTGAALFLSDAPEWIKTCIAGVCIGAVATCLAAPGWILDAIAREAPSNRIAAAITAAFEGDLASYGLGTYRLRRELDARALDAIGSSDVKQIVFGHGTSNSAELAAGLARNPDPNRILHDELLRVMYEWGMVGLILWVMFFGSITLFAIRGTRKDHAGFAKPLLIYLPAFAIGLAGENIIAGAGNDVTVGFLLLIALASVPHRSTQLRTHRTRETIPVYSAA